MQALVRGLRLLDVLSEASGPVRFNALQEATGLPKATLNRVIQTLIDERYLRETDQGYRLGARPFQLAHRVWDGFDLRGAAAPELARLARKHNEATRLAVLDNAQVLYIDQRDAQREVRIGSAVGQRAALHATALGKALAAHLDEGARRRLYASDLAAITDATVTSAGDLDRQLNMIKARGYAVSIREHHEELAGVAAPVLDHTARAIGAIGIVGPAYRLGEDRLHALGREVIEAARHISGNIGELAMSIGVARRPLQEVTGSVELAIPGEDFLGEGPHWDADAGVLHWVDILAPALVSSDGKVTARRETALPELTGVAIPKTSGGFILGGETGIHALEPDGTLEKLADPEADRSGNRFNDGKCDAKGRLWLGSLAISTEPGQGALWRYANGETYKALDGITVANGLGWSPDNKTFYFTDTGAKTIWAFGYDLETGTLGNRRVFAEFDGANGVPDGLCVDAEGGVWVAMWDGWCVQRFLPDGTPDQKITVPVPRPTSCAFGGADLSTLYITTARIRLSAAQLDEAPLSGALLAANPGVRGQKAHPFAG
ncbi:Gluconolactonase [Candidatus Rhodobacter oscarellae]|uniref:Gluconolactonase n=2 Tax=Candidatus Rhodobacter oscarellae TaxID=1675527 RepID=A0A0J9GXX0_9RHOB|nr:Gluconolactonase [Candidatus Rhodobacter lobularis]